MKRRMTVLAVLLVSMSISFTGCGGAGGHSDGDVMTGPAPDDSNLPAEVREYRAKEKAEWDKRAAQQAAKAEKKAAKKK